MALTKRSVFFSSAPPLQFNNIDIRGEGGEHVIEAATIAKERFFRSQRTPHVQRKCVCVCVCVSACVRPSILVRRALTSHHIIHTHARACVCVCVCGARAIKDLGDAETSKFYTEALLRKSFAPFFAPCVVHMLLMTTAMDTLVFERITEHVQSTFRARAEHVTQHVTEHVSFPWGF